MTLKQNKKTTVIKTPIKVEGVQYDSIRQASLKYGLVYRLVHARLKKGYSVEEAFELVYRQPKTIKSITVNGKDYVSLADAVKAYNLKYQTVRSRLNNGFSIEEAFGLKLRKTQKPGFKGIQVTFQGKTYPSNKSLAAAYGINYSTFSGRLERGYSLTEALGLNQRKIEKKPRQGNEITVGDKTYRSIKEAVEAYESSYQVVSGRLRNGDTVEEAFDLVKRKKKTRVSPGIVVCVEGKTYISIKAAAIAYDKCPNLVRVRMKKGNWTIEEALDISPRANYKAKIPITVECKIFKSVKAAAHEYGLNYKAVHYRLHNGYSIEEAFEICDRSRKGVEILVEGKLYPSRIAVCEAYKKNYKLVQSRTQNGWTIEEALDLIPREFYENGEVGYIYLITNNVTQKEYVGATRSTPEVRFKGHVRYAYQEDSILSINGLHYDIKKYGIKKFELKVLDSAKSLGELRQLEESYIKTHNSLTPLGYNLTSKSYGLDSIGTKTIVEGVEYPSLRDAARAYKISHETIRGRLIEGWSYEEAFGIVERKNLNAVVLERVEYASRLQAAKAYKIDVKLVEARLKIGWDNEEAFGIKTKPNASHSPVVVNDTCFPSLAAAAKEHKISLALVRSRKRKGFTIEETLGIKEREIIHPLHTQLQVQGKTFSTVKEAADFYKIKPATVRNRLVNGYTTEEALGVIRRKRRARKKNSEEITVNGQIFMNLKEAANCFNIKKSIIQGRLNAKWPINEAFGLAPKMKKDHIEVQGVIYASIAEAAKKHSLQPYLVKARIKLGWSIDEALQIIARPEIKGVPISVTVEGKLFKSKKDAAEAYRIPYGVFKWRLEAGWSPEQAAGIEHRPQKNGLNSISINGRVFPSIRAAATAFGLKPATVCRRIRDLGWSVEEALEIEQNVS